MADQENPETTEPEAAAPEAPAEEAAPEAAAADAAPEAAAEEAAPEAPAAVKGLFYGGGFDQLWRQAVGAFAVLAYSFIVTTILALILKFTIGIRTSEAAEVEGLDVALHGESIQ